MIRVRFEIILFVVLLSQAFTLFAQEWNGGNISLLLYLGKYAKARQLLEKGIGVDSTSADLYFLLGLAYSLQNNHRTALNWFNKSYRIDSTHVNNLNYLANTQLKLGYRNRAEKLFSKAVRLDSERVDIWDSLGKLYYSSLRYNDSYKIYSKLSQKYVDNSYFNLMCARCAIKLDSLDSAIWQYKIAYNKDPENIEIILEFSRNLFSKDSLDKALELLQAGLTFASKNRHLHRLKGDILYKREDFTVAILSYLNAMAYGDESVELLKKLGFCYYADQNYQKSKDVLEQSLKFDDRDPLIYFYLGMSCKQLKDNPRAIDYFKHALSCLQPVYLDNLYTAIADCYHAEEQFAEAIKCLRRALEYTSQKEFIYYNLANVYYDFYADRNVPLLYYKKARKKEINPMISEYIDQKITELTQEIFFNP